MSDNRPYRHHQYRSEEILLPAICLAIAGILAIASVFLYKPDGNWFERILDYQEIFGSFWRVLFLILLTLAGGFCGYVGKHAYGWPGRLLAFGGLTSVTIALFRVLMPFIVAILIIAAALLWSNSSGRGGAPYNRRRRY